MKTIFFFSVIVFLPRIIFAQEFYFKCTYNNDIPPVLFVVPEDNVFENLILNRIPLIKDSGRSAHISLKPSKIAFLKIGFDALLVSPGDHVEGYFNGSDLEIKDTNSINFTLTKISRGFSRIVNKYPVGGDFNLFKSVVDTLNQYIDSTSTVLTNDSTGLLAEGVSIALKEYLSVRLAHFLVLPILFKNDYDKNQLREIIKKNIQIRYPEY
jgi:hypothetical protein